MNTYGKKVTEKEARDVKYPKKLHHKSDEIFNQDFEESKHIPNEINIINRGIGPLDEVKMSSYNKFLTLIPNIWFFEKDHVYKISAKKKENLFFQILSRSEGQMLVVIFNISILDKKPLFSPIVLINLCRDNIKIAEAIYWKNELLEKNCLSVNKSEMELNREFNLWLDDYIRNGYIVKL